jgi:DNA-binding NarL/FixJ family response regulator
MTIRVFVVDDHPVVREGLKALLASAEDLCVVGSARSAREGEEQLAATGADVVLLDLALGDEQGLRVLPVLRRAAPHAKFLVLTGLRDASWHRDALVAGAHGFVSKEEAPEILSRAIRAVHSGELWFDRRLLESTLHQALDAVQRLDPDRARIASLTPREREVTALVAEGLRNEDIARRLALSEKTVRNHVVDVCRKLGVPGRLELLVYANHHELGRLATGGPLR